MVEVWKTVLLAALLAVLLFPLVWLVGTSLQGEGETFATPSSVVSELTLSNYTTVWNTTSMPRNLLNSTVIAVSTSILALVLGMPAAYGISRCKDRLAGTVAFTILSFRFLPPVAIALPLVFVFRRISLTGSLLAVIIPHLTFTLPFVVWVMMKYFDTIPSVIDDMARVEGCSRLQAFLNVMLPLVSPYALVTGAFCFIFSWNEFLFSLIMTSAETKTAPVAAMKFVTAKGIAWGEITAAGALITVPVLALSLVLYGHITERMRFGRVR